MRREKINIKWVKIGCNFPSGKMPYKMDQNRLHLSWVKKTLMSGFLGGKCIYKKGHFRLFFCVHNPHQISLTTDSDKKQFNE